MKSTLCWMVLSAILLIIGNPVVSQISGTILDDRDGEPLFGATVLIKGTSTGSITDEEGQFQLKLPANGPATLVISYVGYEKQEVAVSGGSALVNVRMVESSGSLNTLVVSASLVEESRLEAPVSIESMDARAIRGNASIDAYGAIANMKGVQANSGSLTFTSMNTRGFADMQNWRFVQLFDGMDAAAPGLGYAAGGNSGPADIDIASIELVPGANSALYGANAFNGLLSIRTKSPFTYQGLSAYAKGGVTVQEAGGTNPLLDAGLRYANAVGDRFAYKFTFSTLQATDWTANDESYYISLSRVPFAEQLLATPRNDPNFDAVNVYGDDVQTPVVLGPGDTTLINRTGFKESEIVDYAVQQYKVGGSLHYKVHEDLELSYGYNFMQSDAILRHTTIYPFKDFRQQWHRLALEAPHFHLKGYYSMDDAGNSYAMLATGAVLESLKPNDLWAADYGAAYRGEITDVTAGDHDAARQYADRDRPGPESEAFQQALQASLENPNFALGGSKFIDVSSLLSVDGFYDFTEHTDVVEVQAGANFKRNRLDSEGTLYNDGDLGFGEPIPVNEYGGFVQVGKSVLDDHLTVRASARYDKNENYEGRFTPRASIVAALDQNKNHYLRASYQTGFRNPSPQESYIALDLGPAILIGGLENNLANYNYLLPDGSTVDGLTIWDGLVTLGSFFAFQATGNPADLVPADLSFLQQEQNNTIDAGYRGLIGEKFYIDLNYYYAWYENFVVRINTVSLATGRVFSAYTNISDETVTSQGVGLGLEYRLPKGLALNGNYTYTSFDADEAIEANPGFIPSFNTPEHRFNVGLSGSRVADTDFGFDLRFRWSDDYIWQSPFGQGNIESFSVVDLAVSYEIPSIHSVVKLGAQNLGRQEYRTVYGGPEVGSIYYVGFTFDEILK